MTKKFFKKALPLLLSAILAFSLVLSLAACGSSNDSGNGGSNSGDSSSNSDSGNTDSGNTDSGNTDSGDSGNGDSGDSDGEAVHAHTLVKTEAKAATCLANGNTEYWYCSGCGKYFADSEAETEISLESTVTTAGHSYSGSWTCTVCGQSLTESEGLEYTLSADGDSYKVSGIGDCADTDIVIPYTYNNLPVTSIGEYSFYYCDEITSVTIPDSVTNIEGAAFGSCHSITNVTIPDSVTNIEYGAFESCYSLTSITIPDSVTELGSGAFRGCEALENINLSENITAIEAVTFSYCSSLESITIPDSVISIGQEAFSYCTSLKNIKLGSGVTSIGLLAFMYCYELESITIPASVTDLGTPERGDKTNYGDCIFNKCPSLKNIEVETGNTAYKSIDGNLYSYDGTKLLAYAAGKTEHSFTVPEDVTEIGCYAFSYATSLQEIDLPSSLKTINRYSFYNSGLVSVNIPEGVTDIGDCAFCGCSSLVNVTIPSTVTENTRGGSTLRGIFDYCSKLIEVYDLTSSEVTFTSWNEDLIPDTVNYFEYIAEVVHTSADEESCLIYQGDYIFYNDNGEYFLASYTGWDTELTLPELTVNGEKVNYAIYDYAFLPFNWGSYDYYEIIITGMQNYNHNIYKITKIVIPDCVTAIGDYAFEYCYGLESITIGNGVTSIGFMAFNDCTCEIVWGDNPTITEIGEGAFYGYAGTSITIPDSVTSIGDYAFVGCSLKSLVIPENITSIGFMAFFKCESLTSVTFENTSGWYVTTTNGAASGTDIDLTSASQNAEYLTDTYCSYYWYKN